MLNQPATEGSMRTLLSLTLLAAALCATACGNAYEPGFHPVSATRSLRDVASRLPPESAERWEPVAGSVASEVPLVDLEPVAPAIPSIPASSTALPARRDDEVDDVVQDVFLAATRGIGEVVEPDAIRGWLATVTVRAARRKLRARRLRAWVGLDRATDYERIASADASPEERSLLVRLYVALDTLPANQRIAWTLRAMEGQRLDVVAASCGCSLATAKRYIGAAQSRLEEMLRDE
jgi:RNA polymerase sigma-70 factor (ECF subfamily)